MRMSCMAPCSSGFGFCSVHQIFDLGTEIWTRPAGQRLNWLKLPRTTCCFVWKLHRFMHSASSGLKTLPFPCLKICFLLEKRHMPTSSRVILKLFSRKPCRPSETRKKPSRVQIPFTTCSGAWVWHSGLASLYVVGVLCNTHFRLSWICRPFLHPFRKSNISWWIKWVI